MLFECFNQHLDNNANFYYIICMYTLSIYLYFINRISYLNIQVVDVSFESCFREQINACAMKLTISQLTYYVHVIHDIHKI